MTPIIRCYHGTPIVLFSRNVLFLSENSKFLRLILKRYLIQSFTEFLPALLKQAYVRQLHRKWVLLISNHRVQMQKNSVMSKIIHEMHILFQLSS